MKELVRYTTKINEFSTYLKNKVTEIQSTFIIADGQTDKYCLPVFMALFPQLAGCCIIKIAQGESNKTYIAVNDIVSELIHKFAGRNALLICLGGGLLCDLGGFTASIYKRGISFCNVPTTLTAMADASLGGKTGLNFCNIKNVIGTFYFPETVFIYPEFLKTLPVSQLRSGYAEILKILLCCSKKEWKKAVTSSYENISKEPELIFRSAELKKQIVDSDPMEKGPRKILNFGHTVGHALEAYSAIYTHNEMLHGDAVAAGIICETFISNRLRLTSNAEFDEVCESIADIYGHCSLDFDNEKLVNLMMNDKKNVSKNVSFTLLNGIGKAVYGQVVSFDIIEDALDFYKKF